MLQKNYSSYHAHIVETLTIKVGLLIAQEKYQEALAIFEEALKILNNDYHMKTVSHLRI